MKKPIDIAKAFGDEIVHLHGNLYRVRRSIVQLAKSGLSVEDGKLIYGNPRWFVNGEGEMEARGTESSKMEELKESIQNSGLDNPIRLRPVMGDNLFLEVVNGERRFRCIEHLCEGEDMCHDPESGTRKKASEAYEWIDCRIEVMDDKTALGIALKMNETSEVIGDLANLHVVQTLRASGYDDQEILKATGKSLSWLRETDRIMGLDDVCLDHFRNDQITRKAAIQLALMENAKERIGMLEKIVEVARGRKEARLKSLDQAVEKANKEGELADVAAYAAGRHGDKEESDRLASKGKTARKKAENARNEKGKAEAKPAKADARDMKKAKGPQPLAHSKIQSEYVDSIESIIENEGFDEEGDSLGLDLGLVSAVLGVLKAIMDGEDDLLSVLSCHCALEIQDADSDDEDKDSDEEEDSDEDKDSDGDEVVGESIENEDADDEANPEDEGEFRATVLTDEDHI